MVQIPEYIAKEELDTDRRGMPQPVVRSGEGEGLEMLGRAQQGLGDAITQLGVHIQQRQKQKDSTQGNYAFEDLKSRTLEKQYEVEQNAPASGEGMHDNTLVEADKIYKEMLPTIPQADQEVFTKRYSIWRRQLSISSAERQHSQTYDYHDGEYKKIAGGYATELANDPSKTDEYRTILYKYADDMPLNNADKKKFKDYADTVLAEGQFAGDRDQDPEATKGKLGFSSKPSAAKTLPIITGTQPGRKALMLEGTRPAVLEKWKQVQGAIGFQAPIVSANRPTLRNIAAGGADKSQHLHGNALDIDVRGLNQQQKLAIIHAASAAGFNGIGVYNNSIHLDMRKGKMAWGPSTRGPSKPGYNPPAWAREALRQHLAGTAVPIPSTASTVETIGYQVPPEKKTKIQVASASTDSSDGASLGGVSPGGIQVIAEEEGFEEKPYDDGGTLRIGHGSDTYTDEQGKSHKVTKDTVVTEEDARRDLEKRIPEFEEIVKKQIGESQWGNLSQGAKDGLVNIAYNKGSLPPELKKAAQSGDTEAIASAIENLPVSAKYPGLRSRYDKAAAIVRGGSTGYTLAGGAAGGQGVDPTYQNMSVEWRLQKLNQLESDQKQIAKERQQAMKIKLDGLIDDSLAAYRIHGEWAGQEPEADMFLTAYPDDAYDRYKQYKADKTVALTVHNIGTMDVSDARALRNDFFNAIPKGEHAAVFERAYEQIDKAVKENEAEFFKRYDKIRSDLKERLEEDPQNYMLSEGIKERDRLTEEYKKTHNLIDDQQLEEFRKRLAARPDSEKNIEESIKIGKQAALDISRARLARQDDIITSMTATGTTGVGPRQDPQEADFVRVDEISGKKNFREYQAKLQAAFATHELFDDPNQTIAKQIEALPSRVATRAGEIGKEVFEKAAKEIITARRADPFKYANDYYPEVRKAWMEYQENKDPENLQSAANMTMAIERTWGMDSTQLAILPRSVTTDVAKHFMDPEKPTTESMNEILNMVTSFVANDTKVAIVNQLIADGLPKLVKPAIDAAVDGGTVGSIARLFEAAKIKDVPQGEQAVTYADLRKAATDQFNESGGDTYYNTVVATAQNYNSAFDAVTLITRDAQARIQSGEGQDEAISNAVLDFMGDQKAHEQTLQAGPSMNIIVKPEDVMYNLSKGFERASEAIDAKLRAGIEKYTVIRGNDVSDVVLPSTGLVEPGNLDLDQRPIVINPDKSISTELSFSREENGQEVLVPSIVNGKVLTTDQAWAHYKKTGEHLGKFDSAEAADRYAEALHERQDRRYGVNYAATATKQKEMTELMDSLMDNGVWINNEGGYSLFDKKSGLFLPNVKTGKTLVISKEQIRKIGGNDPSGLEDFKSGALIEFFTRPDEEYVDVEGLD